MRKSTCFGQFAKNKKKLKRNGKENKMIADKELNAKLKTSVPNYEHQT